MKPTSPMEDQIMFTRTYGAFETVSAQMNTLMDSVEDDSITLRALTKLLISKGVINPDEFQEQLKEASKENHEFQRKMPA